MSMKFNEYQEICKSTKIYPHEYYILYPVLGLCGEAGEVAEKIKKIIRDKPGGFASLTEAENNAIILELGDVLYYVAAIASDLGFSLHNVAHANIAKLQRRKNEGTIKGSGDNRWKK